MSRHELHTTTEDSFGAPAHPDVVAFLEKWAPQRTILELGASGCRLTLPLAKAGFTVFIIDDSPSAIRGYMTKPGAENIRLVRADFRRARLEGVFGAVIVGPANLSRLRTLRAQFELLATAANHITANGIVIVETMTARVNPLPVRSDETAGHRTAFSGAARARPDGG